MTDEWEQFKEVFVSESKENLSVLNTALLNLEKTPEDTGLLNEISRVAHTLKGMAATMGYEKITELSHEMENVLAVLKKGEARPRADIVNILFSCFDSLEILVEEIVSGEEKKLDITELLGKLKNILTQPQAPAPVPAEVKLPAPPEVRLPVPAALQEPGPPVAPRPVNEAAEAPAPAAAGQGEPLVVKVKTETVRLKTEQLDRLMNLVGELVINKARMAQIGRKHKILDLSAALSQFDRISVDLQQEVLKTRMVPVAQIFSRYQRMVRDLSKKLNKDIDFQIIGSEIEVDRILLDEINEPLVHLLRNAIDHGIELPETRTNAGKPARGVLKIIVKREKNHCSIEVNDDGKGMDAEEIRRKALEKGFISFEESKQLSEAETFDLICHPSFSTAGKITDISGRGVGMDVVKNLVGVCNGTLTIRSKKGEGSAFIMQLPLTLAVIKALLVRVSGEEYAIPMANVSEIAQIEPASIKSIESKEVLLLREEVIPLIRLEKMFKCHAADSGRMDYAVIVEIGDRKLALGVDSLAGQQDIVIKTLTGLLKNTRNFSGATILGDGRVILIIDVERLSSRN